MWFAILDAYVFGLHRRQSYQIQTEVNMFSDRETTIAPAVNRNENLHTAFLVFTPNTFAIENKPIFTKFLF